MGFDFTPPPDDFNLEDFQRWVRRVFACVNWDVPMIDLDQDIKVGFKPLPTWENLMVRAALDGLTGEGEDTGAEQPVPRFQIRRTYPPFDKPGLLVITPLNAETLEDAYAEVRPLITERANSLGNGVYTTFGVYWFTVQFWRNGRVVERWRVWDNQAKTEGA